MKIKIKTVVVALALVCLMLSLLIQIPVASASPDKPPKPHPEAKWSEKLQAWIYPTPEDDPDYLTSVAVREGEKIESEELEPQESGDVQTESLPTQSQLTDDVYNAKLYVDRLYKGNIMYSGSSRGVMCEYPATCVNLFDWTEKNAGKPRCWNMAGWDGSTDIITERSITSTKELLDYSYKELTTGISSSPLLWVDRYYYTSSPYCKLIVSARSYSGEHTVDILFEGETLWFDANKYGLKIDREGAVLSYPQSWSVSPIGTFKSFRYTCRHGSQLGGNTYKVWGDTTKYQQLDNLLNDYGFTVDIYDPLWKMSNSYTDDNFMFTKEAYHDCDVYGNLPRSTTSLYADLIYPYKSRVMIDRDIYITESTHDPLLMCIWVIHLLSKYGQPDTLYYYPIPSTPPLYYTPRGVMRQVESTYWDNNGIKYMADFYSTNRLAVFLVAETLLGYKFGDATSKAKAQRAVEVLHTLHTSFGAGEFESKDYGVCIRRQHRGGFLVAYTIGTSYPFAEPKLSALAQWAFDIIKVILGWTDMPPETKGLVPTNQETTMTSIQAIRVFLHYHYGYDYPNSSYIP